MSRTSAAARPADVHPFKLASLLLQYPTMALFDGLVAPWFRGLFIGQPDVAAISGAPLIYQVHATAAWVIWGVWPFSRLVHAWSAPAWYLWRPYVVYRSRRAARTAEPGTTGRRWRRIGSPY